MADAVSNTAIEIKGVRDELMNALTGFKDGAQKDLTGFRSDLETLKGLVDRLDKKELVALSQQVEQIRADLQRPDHGSGQRPELKSAGKLFVESDAFRAFLERGWHRGGVGLKVDSSLLHQLERKTLIDSTAVGSSTPGILVPERVGEIVKPPMRQLRVRALIPFGSTTSNAIEFVKENVFTNAASPQTEGSAKAESALTFTIASATVQTIAHWIPATRQVLDDFAQLQAYIDNRLIDGLNDIEDYELLFGSGVGTHLSGIVTQASSVVGTFATAGDTKVDKINNALAELETAEFMADGVVVNPADWRTMNKIKDQTNNVGNYVLGGPGAMAPAQLWGLPVVRTTAMPVGQFLVGQFRGSVQGFDRMEATVDISTEHSTYFTENKVAIRAEKRLTIAVYRPTGFLKGTY